MGHFLYIIPKGLLHNFFKKPGNPNVKGYQSSLYACFAFMILLSAILPKTIQAQFAGGDGSEGDPYQITTWEHLNNTRNHLDAHFILMNDLDDNTDGYDTYASSTANDNRGWDPIGEAPDPEEFSEFDPFTGTFDGNGYTISDLFINRPSEIGVGLFGHIFSEEFFIAKANTGADEESGGIIQNLNIEDADILGGFFAGIVAGINDGVINNVKTTGQVKGAAGVGGIAGDNYILMIGSSSSANVYLPIDDLDDILEEFDDEFVEFFFSELGGYGGLAGYNSGIVALSYASGFVGITDEGLETLIMEDQSEIIIDLGILAGTGGLAGINDGAIYISYATGDVQGIFGSGGLVGINRFGNAIAASPRKLSTDRSWARASGGNLEAPSIGMEDFEDYFEELEELEIRDAYATGDVKGFVFTGGLLGLNTGGLVSNTYSAGEVIFWPLEYEEEIDEDFSEEDLNEDFGLGGLIGLNDEGLGGLPAILKSKKDLSWKSIEELALNKNVEASEDENENVVNSFWDIQTSKQDTSSGGTGKTTDEMKTIETFTDTSTEGLDESWNFNELWAIRSGEFVSYPYFGNEENAPEQDPPPGLMRIGGSERFLAGAGKETEVPANLFDFDDDDRITIVTVPALGKLLLDDVEVQSNDEIMKSDIEAGKLTFVPENESDKTQYGYEYTVFEYQTTDNQRSVNVDLAARAVDYDNPEGWILISAPSIGQTVGELLDEIRTEGFPGSDNPGASFPTVYTLDQDDYEWEAVSSANQELNQGEGLLVYIFDEDTPDNTMFSSNGPWAPLDGTFTYDDLLGYDPDQGEFGDSHFLIGNPHPIGIEICGMLLNGENIANSIDVWLPQENDGNGGYVNFSCDIVGKEEQTAYDDEYDEIIAPPFGGFWVRTTDENPGLAITENDYVRLDDIATKESEIESRALSLLLNHNEKNYDETVYILFSDEAELGLDRIDAVKLSSAGLAKRYLSFFAMDHEERTYALRSLPAQTNEIVIPLGIETTEAGRYTLEWSLPVRTAGLNFSLRDTKTGEMITLKGGTEYQFNLSEDEIDRVSEKKITDTDIGTLQKTDAVASRFELVISSSDVGTTDEIPNSVTLDQNYPNPFNPTTVIRYQLPQTVQVNLQVFDMAGRKVAELVNGQVTAGTHTVNFDASRLSSGVYMYRLKAGNTMLTRKLTVVK